MKTKESGTLHRLVHRLVHRLASGRRPSPARIVAPLLAAVLVAGCASTEIGAQWSDPQWPKQSLQGTTVLVVCDAPDTTLRLLCESRFSARLAALGAKPVTPPAGGQSDGQPASQATLSAARAAGARSVFQTALRADASAVGTGPTFSFGVGGFGGSSSGFGGGVGVAMPIGGAGGSGGTGLAASSTLVDAAGSGKVIWSARATAPAATDVSAQIDELANVLVGALQQAALF